MSGDYTFKPKQPFDLNKDSNPNNKDSMFLTGLARENVNAAGVTCYVWLYEGAFDQTDYKRTSGSLLRADMGLTTDTLLHGMQDPVFGETRDRKYADKPVRLKGAYAVSANELDFARFGMLLSNDIVQLEFHRYEMEKLCGRRLGPGDVIELPHLGEIGGDGNFKTRFYEVQSLVRSPNGYDAMFVHHMLAATLEPMRDAQEFIDLMERKDRQGVSISDRISNRERELSATGQIQELAEEDTAVTWLDATILYVDEDQVVSHRWTDDGRPPNGHPAQKLSTFPLEPDDGQYVVRVDFFPNRLYRYQDGQWQLKEVDRKREWQRYNWLPALRQHMSDRSKADDIRPWELKSIHDIATPRQGRSKPSPKGNEAFIHVDLQDWKRLTNIEIPEEADSEPLSRIADLIPNPMPTDVAAFLNTDPGEYKYYVIYYVAKRGPGNQQVGEIVINDDGTNTTIDHEWNEIGTVGLTFMTVINAGKRRLKYTLTSGINVELTYLVAARWS